ncbi:MAG TPA: MarR family transcriptional regulator [Syntrophomonadaceae bacterium]|nr:MarR family transcriptional regulator [Syntrophomonadaceae bacterium]
MKKRDLKLVTNILEALECAKEALALLPELPPNIKPVYFRILNAMYRVGDDTRSSRVSDISRVSGLLLPNTTRFINEMVELNIVEKTTSASDKRVVLVRVTELGEQYIQKYVLHVLKGLEEKFSKINEADCMIMIETIHTVCQLMKTVYQEKETGDITMGID